MVKVQVVKTIAEILQYIQSLDDTKKQVFLNLGHQTVCLIIEVSMEIWMNVDILLFFYWLMPNKMEKLALWQ